MTRAWRIAITRGTGERVLDLAGPVVTIGRGVTCAVRLAEEEVAYEHARLHLGERCEVEAVGASLRVGGALIAPPRRVPLERGAELVIGGWRLSVAPAPPDAVPAGLERTASLARELVRDLLGGEPSGGPALHVEIGPEPGRRIALPPPGGRVVVGRGEGSSAVVLDPDLSRMHFAVDRTWDGVRVIDLGSKNGTIVAGVLAPLVEPGAMVCDGELIAAGATRLRLVDPAERYLRELEAASGEPTVSSAPTGLTGSTASSRGSLARSPSVVAFPSASTPRPVTEAPPSRWPLVVAAAIAVLALAALVALLA